MTEPLKIICWNVDHGTSIFIRTPNDKTIVLDAGSSQNFSPIKHLVENWGLTNLDKFILSHADSDHISDIENLDKFLTPTVFLSNKTVPNNIIYPTFPPVINPLKYYYDFSNRYSETIGPDHPLFSDSINWGGVTVRNFCNEYPKYNFSNLNDYSNVSVILYKNLEFLFPGDLEPAGFEALLQNDNFRKTCTPSSSNQKEIRILVASHHGRKSGVYKPFLDLYKPQLTIISDQYGAETTDYKTYYEVTSGFDVYDTASEKYETRYVISTKLNDFIYTSCDDNLIFVSI